MLVIFFTPPRGGAGTSPLNTPLLKTIPSSLGYAAGVDRGNECLKHVNAAQSILNSENF